MNPINKFQSSQFSFEDCPLDPSEPSFPFNLHKPKTEIFPTTTTNPIFTNKLATQEDLIPVLERRKNRDNTHSPGSNPFINLQRFSSKIKFIKTPQPNKTLPSLLNPNLKAFLSKSLLNHFLFKEWDPFLLEKLVSELEPVVLNKNQFLVKGIGSIRSFYVIEQGSILLKEQENIVLQLPGDLLCVSAIFQPIEVKDLSLEAQEDGTVVWGVEFLKFQELLKNNAYSALQENRRFLDGVHSFDFLSKENKNEIAFYLKTVKYPSGGTITQSLEHLYIIKSGVIRIVGGGVLKEKEVFGEDEEGLIIGRVETEEDAVLLSICKKTLKLILGLRYTRMEEVQRLRKLIDISGILGILDPISKERVIRKLKVLNVNKEEVFWKENEQKLIFLLEGEVISDSGELILQKRGIFNEESLIIEKKLGFKQLKLGSDKGKIAIIDFKKLGQVLKTNNLQEYFLLLKKNYKKEDLGSPISPFIHVRFINQALKTCINEIRKHQRFDLVRILKEIGDGQFGLVLLAAIEGRFYALKVISRFWVIQHHIEDYLINEKKICRMIDCPFIIHLEFTFHDQYNIYLLFEYIEGLDLFKFMNISGIIPMNLAKFYAANIILAIEYLHNKRIIHRDLKPENIMIAKNGFLKVIDLGAAKLFGEEDHLSSSNSGLGSEKEDIPLQRTYTLIGTPEYLAPETIKGTGYHFPVDLWAFGVILFEMLCGYCPFGHNKTEPMEIYQSILEDELKFPKFLKDLQARKVIKQLLRKYPEERWEGSFDALKAKKWFDEVQWEEIAKLKGGIAPFVPKNKEIEKEIAGLMKEKIITLKEVLARSGLEELKKKAEILNLKETPDWDEVF